MNTENKHIDSDLFKKYFAGTMSPEEKLAFEKNLENDPFCKDAFEGFQFLDSDAKRVSSLENINLKFQEKFDLQKNENTFPIKTAVGIAASVVLLVGTFFLFKNSLFQNQNTLAENKVEEEEIIEETTALNTTETDVIIYNDSDKIIIGFEEEYEDIAPAPIASEKVAAEAKKSGTFELEKQAEAKATQSKQDSRGALAQESATTDMFSGNDKTLMENAVETTASRSKEISSEMISDYKSGILSYNQSNFEEAIIAFNSSIKKNQNTLNSNYYIGMSNFNMANYNNAITYFDKVISANSNFADDAKYYKALTLIGKGQKEKAKVLLTELANSNSSFKTAAQNKLKSL